MEEPVLELHTLQGAACILKHAIEAHEHVEQMIQDESTETE